MMTLYGIPGIEPPGDFKAQYKRRFSDAQVNEQFDMGSLRYSGQGEYPAIQFKRIGDEWLLVDLGEQAPVW